MSKLRGDSILKQVPEVQGFKVLPPAVLYDKIGQGGMGAVYRGRHLNLEVEVAVKCLRPGLAADSNNFVLRFQREAKLAASIRHENLIQVYDAASVGDVHYLVMDFVDGESARQRVRRKGPLSEHEAATILLGAAKGLAVAHRQRIVHRDVKPDNILISRDGAVKLADLGIARLVDSEEYQTLTSGSIGTPQYMPPEQWMHAARVTPAADVWALGATLFFLLTGRNAIRGINQGECALEICNQDFPDIATHLPRITPSLREFLRKMTDRLPERRHPDASAVVAELRTLLGAASVELADELAGSDRAGSELVSPPPAETLARIRVEVSTGGSRSDTEPIGSNPSADSGPMEPTRKSPKAANAAGSDRGTLPNVQPQASARKRPWLALSLSALLAGAIVGTWLLMTRKPESEPHAPPRVRTDGSKPTPATAAPAALPDAQPVQASASVRGWSTSELNYVQTHAPKLEIVGQLGREGSLEVIVNDGLVETISASDTTLPTQWDAAFRKSSAEQRVELALASERFEHCPGQLPVAVRCDRAEAGLCRGPLD